MRRFILLQGTHAETRGDGTLMVYGVGDVIETDKDLCAIWNKNGQEPRFQEVT